MFQLKAVTKPWISHSLSKKTDALRLLSLITLKMITPLKAPRKYKLCDKTFLRKLWYQRFLIFLVSQLTHALSCRQRQNVLSCNKLSVGWGQVLQGGVHVADLQWRSRAPYSSSEASERGHTASRGSTWAESEMDHHASWWNWISIWWGERRHPHRDPPFPFQTHRRVKLNKPAILGLADRTQADGNFSRNPRPSADSARTL